MKYQSIAIRYLTYLLFVGTLAGCSSSEEQQEKYLSRAQSLYDESNYTKAKLELRNVFQINPKNAEAFYLKALINEKEGEIRPVIKNLHAAVEFDPNYVEARIKLGQMFFLFGPRGDERTKEQIDAVLALDENNADAHALFSQLLYRQKDEEAAIHEAKRALSIDPGNKNSIVVLAQIYKDSDPEYVLSIIDAGINQRPESSELKLIKILNLSAKNNKEDREDIVALYEKLIADEPSFYRHFGFYLYSIGRIDDTETLLRNMVKSYPDSTEYKLTFLDFLAKNRDLTLATATAKELIASHPDENELRFALAKMYLESDQSSKAENIFQDIIEKDVDGVDSLRARNELVAMKLNQEDSDGAMAVLVEILEIEPANTQALTTRARLYLSTNQNQAAIEDARSLVKNNSNSDSAMYLLASAHEANGEKGLALDYYRNSLKLNRENSLAALRMNQLLIAQDDVAAADRVLESFLEINPTDSVVSRTLFESYLKQGRWDDAIKIAEILEQQPKNNVLGIYLKGLAFFLHEEYLSSIAEFKEVLELEPSLVEALSYLIEAQLKLGEESEAQKYLEEHIELYPDQMHARMLQGSLYTRSGNIEAAVASYKAILLRDPKNIGAHIAVAQAYLAQGDTKSAIDMFDEALQISPDDIRILALKAGTMEAQGEYKEAAIIYEEILALDSNQQIAANNLAMLLVDEFPDEKAFQRALEITANFEDSDIPTLLDTRGWVYYKNADYVNALRILKPIVESENTQDIFWYHLGMTYIKLGNEPAAKAALTNALKNGDSFSGGKEASKLVKQL